jgi:TrmH family RNA methyltransferase
MGLDHVDIVLSRPSEPRNVGAVCRAMKNAGISNLVVATGADLDRDAARPLAVGAADVLERARVVPTLTEAIGRNPLAAGITRRTGQRRKSVSFSPWQLAARVVRRSDDPESGPPSVPGRISVVFGNEQSGLSEDELSLCNMAVSIPSNPEFPSLNLSHAVQVVCYELYLADLQWPAAPRPATGGPQTPRGGGFLTPDELTRQVELVSAHLETLGFHTQGGPQGIPTLLRDILARAMTSPREIGRFVALFEKLAGMHGRGSRQLPGQSDM